MCDLCNAKFTRTQLARKNESRWDYVCSSVQYQTFTTDPAKDCSWPGPPFPGVSMKLPFGPGQFAAL